MQVSPYNTLLEVLASQAATIPGHPAVEFEGTTISYKTLWEGIQSFGRHLLNLGLKPGDRVLITLPNSIEFFYAFYGVQIAGGIAVPIFPNSGEKRILNFARLCGARILVLPSNIPQKIFAAYQKAGDTHQLHLTTVSIGNNGEQNVHNPSFPQIQGEDIAFLQYTSGSTGNPKGVIISHKNLIINILQMIVGMEITKEDIFVSWLPVYHDMGLILKTMVPFYLGITTILLPTDLTNVGKWITTLQDHQATFTAAPDFAYRLCLRHLTPSDYDISNLRVALNAAEPVRSSTIQEFEQAFGLSNVMVAGYGLAEATVGVSMWKPQTKNKIDKRGFVSVGKPFPEIEIKIMENGRPLPPGEIGEIVIKSPANALGYFNNPEATNASFLDSGFLLSGDLGYLDPDGHLYIVSRKKNIIKRAGETLAPQEIEELADQLPGIRYSAVLGVDRGKLEGEQVYVFAEVRSPEDKTQADLHHLIIDLVAEIYRQAGFRPARVYLLQPKSIPLTHNGKIQHAALKAAYLNGSLKASGAILYPEY